MCLILAQAQQSIEWRPPITEDNKAASWGQTIDFLSSTLVNASTSLVQLRNSEHCHLSYIEGPKDAFALGFTWHGNKVVMLDKGGLMNRLGVKDDTEVREFHFKTDGTQRLFPGEKRTEVWTAWYAMNSKQRAALLMRLRPGDQVGVAIKGDKGSEIRFETVTKQDVGEGEIAQVNGGEGLRLRSQGIDLDLSKVDPLSVRVFDLQSISMLGTNNGTIAKRDGGDTSPSTDTAQVTFRLNDPEIAKRFARGILHAAVLCGGTKAVSPF
jgi:hypothetical protein